MAVKNITSENFGQEVENSNITVLIDFWASWCGPCKMLGPIIDELAPEYEGIVKICKVNVDEQPDLAVRFRIMGVPTLLAMKNGEVIKRITGSRNKAHLIDLLEEIR